MNSEEKVNYLIKLESSSKLSKLHLKKILSFSEDEDEFVRSLVASLLVNYNTKVSKKVLLRLSYDKDSLVRTEAYDSLCVFPTKDIERRLRYAIIKEKNALACYYAILSWLDVVIARGGNKKKNYFFIKKMEKSSRFQKSEHCLLACAEAQYIMGNRNALKKILRFLNSKEYLVRCATIKTLEDVVNDENRRIIIKALQHFSEKEQTLGAKSDAEEVLERLIKHIKD